MYQAISAEPWIQFLQTRPHFMQNVKSNKNVLPKYQNIPSIRGLGPKNKLCDNWAQNTYQAISQDP